MQVYDIIALVSAFMLIQSPILYIVHRRDKEIERLRARLGEA